MSQSHTAGGDRKVVVTGVGVIAPVGDTLEAVHGALCRGESGFRPIEAFKTDAAEAQGLSNLVAGEVPGFTARDYLRPGNLRPLDRAAQLAAAATHKALRQAGFEEDLAEHEVGLVLGTLFGGIHTISAFDRRALEAGPQYAKPLDFANSVINAPAGQTAIWHRLRGVNSTICSGTASGLLALGYAADLIRTGRADALVAGGADELCFESFLGYRRTGRSTGSNGQPPRSVPFDPSSTGFTLGEGAALLVLEAEESAAARGAKPLAIIRGQAGGFGIQGGSEARDEVLSRVIREALEDAGVGPRDLAAVSASASGLPATDRAEAEGLAHALGEGGASLPVTAIKSMLGESLGASGALQAAVLLKSLAENQLPGIAGLKVPDNGFPLSGALSSAQSIQGSTGLVSCLAFDGHVGALVLESLS